MRELPHFMRRHRKTFIHLAVSAIGIACGAFWFLSNLGLPVYSRGIMCCDSMQFLWLSTQEIGSLIYHLSERTFGYPLYLAVFQWLYSPAPQEVALASAFTTQFILSVIGSTVLFFGFRSTGLKVPLICYALLLAHPALAGIAAIPLTDSLGSSLASAFIGVVALLCASQRHLWAKCLALGFFAGTILSVRPPSTPFIIIWTALLLPLVAWGAFVQSRSVITTTQALCIAATCYAIGFLPVGGHLLNNCYTAHKTLCVIDPGLARAPLASSLELNYQYSRAWGSVDPVKSWEWHFTEDAVLQNCAFSREDPMNSLKECYSGNISRLPKHLLHRTVGLFDYRHLNPYAALETSNAEYWILRTFSAVGILGLISGIALVLCHLCAGSLQRYGYLLLPLSYFAVQVNLHTENRYLLSAVPSLFLLGAATLSGRLFKRGWIQVMCLCLSAIVLTYAYYLVSLWDELSIQLTGSR